MFEGFWAQRAYYVRLLGDFDAIRDWGLGFRLLNPEP